MCIVPLVYDCYPKISTSFYGCSLLGHSAAVLRQDHCKLPVGQLRTCCNYISVEKGRLQRPSIAIKDLGDIALLLP